jgi:hypothetical protein
MMIFYANLCLFSLLIFFFWIVSITILALVTRLIFDWGASSRITRSPADALLVEFRGTTGIFAYDVRVNF